MVAFRVCTDRQKLKLPKSIRIQPGDINIPIVNIRDPEKVIQKRPRTDVNLALIADGSDFG
jgi:hypothetical protein